MPDAPDQKSSARAEVRAAERGITGAYRSASDAAIARALLSTPEYRDSRTIFCFVGTSREIDTTQVMRDALASGRRVAAPRVEGPGVMSLREIASEADLVPGAYGIREPRDDAPRVEAASVDLAIVPCASCDERGRRLGQGGGYYDRWLAGYEGRAVMLCRDDLMRVSLPTEPHDAVIPTVVTDRWIYRAISEEGRPTPTRARVLRGALLGGARPLVCAPIVASDEAATVEQARALASASPDVIELRADAWSFTSDVERAVRAASSVRDAIGEIPLILTCRAPEENGMSVVPPGAKLELYARAASDGIADLVDVELSLGAEAIARVRADLSRTLCGMIISHHNFTKTPGEDAMADILRREAEAGADVLKLAVMPTRSEDVLALLRATLAARRAHPRCPMITMSMGALGAVTRAAGGLFGSDLTFAVGAESSAPGQMALADVRACLEVLCR